MSRLAAGPTVWLIASRPSSGLCARSDRHSSTLSLRLTTPVKRCHDDHLVALVRAGHAGAFEEVVARYTPALIRHADRFLSTSRPDAEEAVQDGFLRALVALRRDVAQPIVLKPWLYQIVANACRDRLRKPVRTVSMELCGHLLAAPDSTPYEQLMMRERLDRALQGLNGLPGRQRSALVALELEGRTHEQIAAEMGTTVTASKALVWRARANMPRMSAAA